MVTVTENAAAKIKAQAAELQKTGAKQLIVDIRRTAEGSLPCGLAEEETRIVSPSGGILF